MAICGCLGRCDCSVTGGNNIQVTGSGDFNDPFVVNALDSPTFQATSVDSSIELIPGGPLGHQPNIEVRIDPDSTAIITTSPSGLRIDTDSGGSAVAVADTDSVDLTLAAGTVTADVRFDPDGGITESAAGIGLAIVPDNIVFATNGMFTKASYPGMRGVEVEVQAGGAGSGSTATTAGGQTASSAGGGAGEYSRVIVLEAALAANETVTVGSGGLGGAAGGVNAGSAGGNSSFGAHAVANGGTPSAGGSAGGGDGFSGGGLGGTGGTGDLTVDGGDGGFSGRLNAVPVPTNRGAASFLSTEARAPNVSAGTAYDGKGHGGGAGGQSAGASTASRAGANGADGRVIVRVF